MLGEFFPTNHPVRDAALSGRAFLGTLAPAVAMAEMEVAFTALSTSNTKARSLSLFDEFRASSEARSAAIAPWSLQTAASFARRRRRGLR